MSQMVVGLVAGICVVSQFSARAGSPPTLEELSKLPTFANYKAEPYVIAAASLQAIGKEKAIVLLTELAQSKDREDEKRTLLLCRMLFAPKSNGTFRRSFLGAPCFISPTASNDWPTVFKDWPFEPLAIVDGIPFLVVRGYVGGGGIPERAKEYLDYCLENCDWNSEVFKVKSVKEKHSALDRLVASPKWKTPLAEETKKAIILQIE